MTGSLTPPMGDIGSRVQTGSTRAPVAIALLALIPAALMLVAVSVPGVQLGPFVVGVVAWVLVGIAWVVALLWPREEGRRHASRWLWGLTPAVLLLTWALAISGLPLMARFTVSQAAFEGLPDRHLTYETPGTAGLYEVVCCYERTDFGYQFGVSEEITTVWGFAFSPDGPPPGPDIDADLHEGDNGYRHLNGSWYVWRFRYT